MNKWSCNEVCYVEWQEGSEECYHVFAKCFPLELVVVVVIQVFVGKRMKVEEAAVESDKLCGC